MANLIPPSIMAVVYGATGNVSIGGLFLAGIVPGVLIGIGLMIYSHFFGPAGIRKPRATLCQFADATRASILPLMIPLIIMGGILTGWFTPTEAGMVASVYILLVLVPLLARGHIRHLPRDFVYTGLLYSIPLAWWRPARFRLDARLPARSDIVSGWIELFAGHDGRLIMLLLVLLFIVIGDFMDAVPAIIIFMPIVIKLNELAASTPAHGVVLITTLVFGLITPPYGLSLLVASKFVGVAFTRAMLASLPIYVVFLVTIAFTVLFPESCSICRSCCFPSRSAASRTRAARLHLPEVRPDPPTDCGLQSPTSWHAACLLAQRVRRRTRPPPSNGTPPPPHTARRPCRSRREQHERVAVNGSRAARRSPPGSAPRRVGGRRACGRG
jgi:TRAP-type C4-dicarboxylate transport system permease large subunit